MFLMQCLDGFKQMTDWSMWVKSGGSIKGLRLGSQHRLALPGESDRAEVALASNFGQNHDNHKAASSKQGGSGRGSVNQMPSRPPVKLPRITNATTAALDHPDPTNPSHVLAVAPAAERDPEVPPRSNCWC